MIFFHFSFVVLLGVCIFTAPLVCSATIKLQCINVHRNGFKRPLKSPLLFLTASRRARMTRCAEEAEIANVVRYRSSSRSIRDVQTELGPSCELPWHLIALQDLRAFLRLSPFLLPSCCLPYRHVSPVYAYTRSRCLISYRFSRVLNQVTRGWDESERGSSSHNNNPKLKTIALSYRLEHCSCTLGTA